MNKVVLHSSNELSSNVSAQKAKHVVARVKDSNESILFIY